ncbi:MAG: aldehyde dehydrogenase family protein [Deltaproteobacteria bacterium]|nr:aldehyde dehydrogenase family protein [Deltaproteobacteria bacterium]MBW2421185.1 aldehyde dehydrogenase family protein [Deltaproteobacteria bacterium]
MAIVSKLDTPEGSPRRLQLSSPATLEPIGEIEVLPPDGVRAALEAARKAQPAWAALSFAERASYMRRALAALLEKQDEFIEVILSETPKTRNEALMMDIYAGCDALHFYAKETAKLLRPERKRLHGLVGIAKKLQVVYKPLGVVGVISPWNGPFILSLNPTVQALMAGNAVLLKPSSSTAFSGGLVGKLFEAAGLPEGLLTVLQGDSQTGQALLEVGVDKISFTGSEETGRHVAVTCAERFIPCTLELGGKNPLIVCADANLDNAAAGAIAGNFFNAGQYCGGTERVYVVEEVADAFIEKVVARASQLRQGAEGEFDVGAIYWPSQLEIVEEHVTDAVAKGARVLVGGRRNPELKGLFYEPTVLTDVSTDMRVLREETFGPVMPIIRVRDEEEAIRLANDSNYGLTASIWTKDTRRGFEIAKRIDTGSVDINDFPQTYGSSEAPFGGRKASGVGQVNGAVGLRGYCHAQPIQTDRFGGRQTAGRYPLSLKDDEGFQKFMRFLWGNPLGRMISMMRVPW